MGPIASPGVSVPEFLRKSIATCDFPTWVPVQIFIGVTALSYGPGRKKTCLPGLLTTKVHVTNIIKIIYIDGQKKRYNRSTCVILQGKNMWPKSKSCTS